MATPPDSASAGSASTPIIFRFIWFHVHSCLSGGAVAPRHPPPVSALLGPAHRRPHPHPAEIGAAVRLTDDRFRRGRGPGGALDEQRTADAAWEQDGAHPADDRGGWQSSPAGGKRWDTP